MTMTERGKPLYTCDECGGGNVLCLPDCPQQRHWEAVRPKACPCCGTSTEVGSLVLRCPGRAVVRHAREDDRAWLADHPDAEERHRPATVAEQTMYFLFDSRLVTRVLVFWARGYDHVGTRKVETKSLLWTAY
jgi:hypothetical protein